MKTKISIKRKNSGHGRRFFGSKPFLGFSLLCLLSLILIFPVTAQNIVKAEYFFNNDPGLGMGTNISIPSPAPQLENLSFTTAVDLLETGFNRLFVRAKNSDGKWTLTQNRTFYKSALTLELPDIVKAEYFLNNDPGFGSGINIPIPNPLSALQNIDFMADISGLDNGFNRLIVRVKDANGKWTQSQVRTFYKAVMPVEQPDIVKAEYFFNNDPGPGSGINIPVSNPSNNLKNMEFVADVSGLGGGFNYLFLRAKDANGKWTQTNVRAFYKSSIPLDLPNIVKAEYFINTDPGIGMGVNIPVASPGVKVENLQFVADISDLPLGKHKLFVRSKDVLGKWSLTFLDEICKTPFANFTTDIAEFGNPTSFTNLSEFTDEDTGYFWDVDNDGVFDYTGGQDFIHLYPAPGSFNARLMVTTPDGCSESIVKEVLVYACMVPTELSAEDITYQSVNLNWTPGNFGSQWEILYGLHGFDPETEGTFIGNIETNNYFLDGLEPETAYDFYVRTVCDAPEVSDWSGPETFSTLEYFCPPDWTVSPYYQYNMQIIGKLFIEGVQSANPHDYIGAFVNGECRGMASPDPDLFGLVFLTVGSDLTSGEMVDFVIWNVDECAECPTGESMLFENQLQVGSPGNPYPFECGQHELPLAFGAGYNWFSVNINPGSMALNDLFAGLAPCEEDRILGQNSFAIVYNGSWVGSLAAINPTDMYKMQLCSQQNLTIGGQPTANNPISLGAGYTWLGYLPQGGLAINEALSAINPIPAEDNRILGQNAFAVYYQGQWIGSLTQLHPGKGYIIELSNQSTLTYPAATDGESLEPEDKIFSPSGQMPLAFQQFNMMLIAQLELPDGLISTNPEDVIYAFSGEECRGMAVPSQENGGMTFMSIGANVQAGEEITFKAWLSEFETLADIKQTIEFEELKKAGTMEQPVLLTLKGFTGIETQTASEIFIGEPTPNPFNDQTELSFSLPSAANVKLTLYNSHGQLMDVITEGFRNAGLHKVTIPRNNLPVGVYFFRIEIFNNDFEVQKNGKIIISQ